MDEIKERPDKANINKPLKRNRKYIFIYLICSAVVIGLLFGGNRFIKTRKGRAGATGGGLKKMSGIEKIKNIFYKDKQTNTREYTLEGLIYDNEKSSVIISGIVLRLHEKIDDWEVVRITPTSVELENVKDSTSLNLSL